ncbi:MAG TPA: hypothetical protein DD670_08700 [Planctomycetaceae bacterium]|nr:hypothetical protein [Planctomycetaceae bacterium]
MAQENNTLANFARGLVALLILACGVAGMAAMVVYGKKASPLVEPEPLRPPMVEVALVEPQEERLDIEVDGVVVPRREISVAAEVGGRVIGKSDVCRAGKFVRQGTLLIEIDPRDHDIEKRRLEEQLKQAEATLEELHVEETNTQELIKLAEDTLALKQREIARLEKIAEQGKDYVTESQLDAERSNELGARNALVTLQNQLRSIQSRRGGLNAARDLVRANLEKAALSLERTRITAPIDGMIVRDFVEADGYVAPGTVLAIIEDVSKCEVRCNLRMDQLYWIWNQERPNGSTPPVPGDGQDYLLPPTESTVIYRLGEHEYTWNGILARYDGIGLDETTRTVPCIVVVDKPNEVRRQGAADASPVRGPRALVRGMYVKVVAHAQLDTELLRVPERAVQPGERGNRAWRVRPDTSGSAEPNEGLLEEVAVKVISVMGDDALVRVVDGNLAPGDHVVVSPMVSADEGMRVRVVVESEKSR